MGKLPQECEVPVGRIQRDALLEWWRYVVGQAVGADLTDTLLLAFRLDDASLDVARIGAEISGVARLRRLVGRTVRNPGAALAASLGCLRADVAVVLRERGDGDLADLIEE
jgi:hypothetical protein